MSEKEQTVLSDDECVSLLRMGNNSVAMARTIERAVLAKLGAEAGAVAVAKLRELIEKWEREAPDLSSRYAEGMRTAACDLECLLAAPPEKQASHSEGVAGMQYDGRAEAVAVLKERGWTFCANGRWYEPLPDDPKQTTVPHSLTVPAHLIERLRHHAADKEGCTAFARSTMSEVLGYLTDQPAAQSNPPEFEGFAPAASLDVEALAQEIRRVDGNHSLGAGALAESLMPFLSRGVPAASEAEPVAWMRSVVTPDTPMGPAEYDVEMVEGREMPYHGDGWAPLYAAPPAPVEAGSVLGYVDPLYLACRTRGMKLNSKIFPEPNDEHTAPVYAAPPEKQTSHSEGGAGGTYRPTEEATRKVCELLDKIKGAYSHWGGWSATPDVCEEAVNLLRYSGCASSTVPHSSTVARGDERDRLLHDLMQHASEAGDHTPDSFRRGVINLANRAHSLARQQGGGDAERIRIGAQLANVAFNWSQHPGKTLTASECQLLRNLCDEWDAARAQRAGNGGA